MDVLLLTPGVVGLSILCVQYSSVAKLYPLPLVSTVPIRRGNMTTHYRRDPRVPRSMHRE